MDKSLTIWYCDICDVPIEDIRRGYVIWKEDKHHLPCDIKIIHQDKCDVGNYPLSSALEDFVGQKGLVQLLNFLHLGRLSYRIGRKPKLIVKTHEAFIDSFRRVQIPYYEEARRCFRNEELLADHPQADESTPDHLKALISEYGSKSQVTNR